MVINRVFAPEVFSKGHAKASELMEERTKLSSNYNNDPLLASMGLTRASIFSTHSTCIKSRKMSYSSANNNATNNNAHSSGTNNNNATERHHTNSNNNNDNDMNNLNGRQYLENTVSAPFKKTFRYRPPELSDYHGR